MAAEGTTSNIAQMATFATQAGDAATGLTQVFSTLAGDLADLEAKSRGRFASAFIAVKSTIATESANMNNALHGIASDIGVAGQNYASADADQQAQMDQVQNVTTGITSGLSGR